VWHVDVYSDLVEVIGEDSGLKRKGKLEQDRYWSKIHRIRPEPFGQQ